MVVPGEGGRRRGCVCALQRLCSDAVAMAGGNYNGSADVKEHENHRRSRSLERVDRSSSRQRRHRSPSVSPPLERASSRRRSAVAEDTRERNVQKENERVVSKDGDGREEVLGRRSREQRAGNSNSGTSSSDDGSRGDEDEESNREEDEGDGDESDKGRKKRKADRNGEKKRKRRHRSVNSDSEEVEEEESDHTGDSSAQSSEDSEEERRKARRRKRRKRREREEREREKEEHRRRKNKVKKNLLLKCSEIKSSGESMLVWLAQCSELCSEFCEI